MSILKVLFIMVFGAVCLALSLGTVVVPLSMNAEDHKWLWFAGFLVSSIGMGTLFTLYLRYEDRTFTHGRPRTGR